MPVRTRISSGQVHVDYEEIAPAVPKINKEDHRGTFDPHKVAYEGSTFEHMGIPEENVRGYTRHLAYLVGPPLPKEMAVQDLLVLTRTSDNPADSVEAAYRKRIRSPLTAIRAHCVMCKGGSPKAASNCDKVECPLWAFHKGNNAYRDRKET